MKTATVTRDLGSATHTLRCATHEAAAFTNEYILGMLTAPDYNPSPDETLAAVDALRQLRSRQPGDLDPIAVTLCGVTITFTPYTNRGLDN